MSNNSGQDENITVKRRRQGASEGPSGRAEAPARRRQEGSGGSGGPGWPTGGGSGGGGGLGGLGGGIGKMPVWLIILLVVGYVIYTMLSNSGSGTQTETGFPTSVSAQEQPTEPVFMPVEPTATSEPLPTEPAAAEQPAPTQPAAEQPAQGAAKGQKWTVMLYQDADDQILEQDIYMDLNEVERVGSSDQVQIVSQIDRFKGAFTGDGDWTSTRRYHILKDNDLNHVGSELVKDLGEKDMADGSTLVDFVTWAAAAYPADKYVLILSDHGMGWPGGMSDPDPAVKDPSRVPLASALGDDQLYLMEMDKALSTIGQKTKIGKFELIGMDACLMGHLEVLSALQPYARYAVLSQETEPALGWAYAGFLQALEANPDVSGAELGKQIVRSYIQDDQRIVDKQARADFLRQGSPFGGLFGQSNQVSAADLAQQIGRSVTLTAVDLSAMPNLMDSVNALAYDLQNEDQDKVASARSYAPAFTNIFGKEGQSPYIDLGGFAQLLKRAGVSAKTSQAVDQVLASLKKAVIAEKHGEGKPGATGVSIYFPNSTLYRTAVAGAQSYTTVANRFAQASLWDDFLAFHYNDIAFKAQPAAPVLPAPGVPSRAPGLGQIQVSPITLSAKTAAPGQPVTLTAKISGKNIGYIYLFVGLYDQAGNSIYEADTDYLESPRSQQINGVYYPQWSANAFNLQFEWDPTLFQITDGHTTTTALFTPQTYGASAKDAVYTVDGIYHYASGGGPGGPARSARLYFRDGVMRQVMGYTDANETGGVREIIPQAGDTFTILERWLDVDASGKVTMPASQEGQVLTFGDQPFRWKEAYAPTGDYVVGFIIQDLDGNAQEVYTKVTVR